MGDKIDLYLTVQVETGVLKLPEEPQMRRNALRRILNHGAVLKRRHQLEWAKISAAVELSLPFEGDTISDRFRISKNNSPILLEELHSHDNRKWLTSILFQLGVLYHRNRESWYSLLFDCEPSYQQAPISISDKEAESETRGNDSESSISNELVAGLTSSGLIS